jgi:hypothetical protein
VPIVVIDHLSQAEESALRISLNRIQELSAWDEAALKAEFEILTTDLELLSYTGFETPKIDLILDIVPDKAKPDSADRVPPLGTGPAVTQPGDIWVFEGGHRLGCGDALDSASFVALMAGEKARLAACDLPYNVPIRGHVSGHAAAREFAMASGEMSRPEFVVFLRTIFEHLVASSIDGSLHLHFMDWRHMSEMLEAGHAVYDELKNLCVWTKDNAGLGSLWRSQHELCFVWKTGRAAHLNNVELGRHGRNRSNVWAYAGGNGFQRGRDEELTGHPTPKSVAMIADAILDVSQLGEIVLDPTCGSGSTLVAAHRTKRRGFGIEIDPLYVDGAVRRLEAFTKAPARHAETGLTFAETAATRVTNDQPMAAE